MKRTIAVASAAGIVALGAAACQPYFSDATLTVTQRGQLATLSWTAATETDAGEFVQEYGIEINGSEVYRYPAASGTSCVLTGLASGTTYNLSMTAYGNTGEWSGTYSGDLAAMARVTSSYTNGTIGASAGSSPTCVAPTDNDGDRLPNLLENNTGTFLNATATGTNPNVADTDGDGIRDGDEVLGTTAGLNLYGMGTRPTKKDLLFEFDWFNDNLDPLVAGNPNTCSAHSHRPTADAVSRVQTAFATTPVTNPDGTLGVNVIADYGQGGLFTGGNLIADANGVIAGGVNNAEFINYKAANFSANREGYFHYSLHPHRYNTSSGSSGQAEIQGDDLIVSLQCYESTVNTGNTIMHEVGHNLNLRHGGNVDTNWKPNYNSVMNYKYQFPGVDNSGCDSVGNNILAYSNGSRASLNENSLLETNGVCGGVDIDWNISGAINPAAIAADINRDSSTQLGGVGDGSFSVLNDFNDAANMCLTCVNDADGAPIDPHNHSTELIDEQPVPVEARVVGR